jgi:hypothetical protein
MSTPDPRPAPTSPQDALLILAKDSADQMQILRQILILEVKQTEHLEGIHRTVSMFGWVFIIGTAFVCIAYVFLRITGGL